MNKPFTFLCACISAFGLLILGLSTYHAVAYGSMEAGVFTRHVYWTKKDMVTGEIERDYAELPTSDVSVLSSIDTWFAGTFVLVGGFALFVFEWSYGSRRKI